MYVGDFCKNSERLKAINFFANISIIDVWTGPKFTSVQYIYRNVLTKWNLVQFSVTKKDKKRESQPKFKLNYPKFMDFLFSVVLSKTFFSDLENFLLITFI